MQNPIVHDIKLLEILEYDHYLMTCDCSADNLKPNQNHELMTSMASLNLGRLPTLELIINIML